jgi:dihydroxy-acid dehydratase
VQFNAFSIHENLTALSGTPLMYRNLLSMEVEELLLTQPLDGAVLLGGCDKTIPALLMGAASANLPCVVVAAGTALPGSVRGRSIGCWDITAALDAVTAGEEDASLLDEMTASMNGSVGTCAIMGTANTMASLAEALGMSPSASAMIPAAHPQRIVAAEEAGRLAVEAWRRNARPRDILTADAFDNAIRVLHALGGSTNAVIHLVAVARRAGVPLTLDRFDALGRTTPFLVDIAPSGARFAEDFFTAGGVPGLMRELLPLLHANSFTVAGRSVRESVATATIDRAVIASLDAPLRPDGGLVVLRGNVAPDGAILKVAAANTRLLKHRGRAIVFESVEDIAARADSVEIQPDDVLVLRNQGPIGYPGMPHVGDLPIPAALRRRGIHDMVRISDATISGTRGGTLIVHVAPEAAVGGALALLRTGDIVQLDAQERRLDMLVPPDELGRRHEALRLDLRIPRRGFANLYVRHVLQAPEGCDFDFLGSEPDAVEDGAARPTPGSARAVAQTPST